MYGLPEDVNLDFFLGATLIQVCVGENEVILNFHPEISVMIAGSVGVTGPDSTQRVLDDARAAGAAILGVLGASVSKVSGTPDGTLRLSCSDGTVLEIYDSWEEFESYTVHHGETVIVV